MGRPIRFLHSSVRARHHAHYGESKFFQCDYQKNQIFLFYCKPKKIYVGTMQRSPSFYLGNSGYLCLQFLFFKSSSPTIPQQECKSLYTKKMYFICKYYIYISSNQQCEYM